MDFFSFIHLQSFFHLCIPSLTLLPGDKCLSNMREAVKLMNCLFKNRSLPDLTVYNPWAGQFGDQATGKCPNASDCQSATGYCPMRREEGRSWQSAAMQRLVQSYHSGECGKFPWNVGGEGVAFSLKMQVVGQSCCTDLDLLRDGTDPWENCPNDLFIHL